MLNFFVPSWTTIDKDKKDSFTNPQKNKVKEGPIFGLLLPYQYL